MDIEELKVRKQRAVALLVTHSDKYRLLYVDIVNVKNPTEEDIKTIETKSKMLKLESNAIHTQISMIDELISYAVQEAEENKVKEEVSEPVEEAAKDAE